MDVLASPSSTGTLFLPANEKTGMHTEIVHFWNPAKKTTVFDESICITFYLVLKHGIESLLFIC